MDVNVSGTFKSGVPHVNVSGTWKEGVATWVNVNGTWKKQEYGSSFPPGSVTYPAMKTFNVGYDSLVQYVGMDTINNTYGSISPNTAVVDGHTFTFTQMNSRTSGSQIYATVECPTLTTNELQGYFVFKHVNNTFERYMSPRSVGQGTNIAFNSSTFRSEIVSNAGGTMSVGLHVDEFYDQRFTQTWSATCGSSNGGVVNYTDFAGDTNVFDQAIFWAAGNDSSIWMRYSGGTFSGFDGGQTGCTYGLTRKLITGQCTITLSASGQSSYVIPGSEIKSPYAPSFQVIIGQHAGLQSFLNAAVGKEVTVTMVDSTERWSGTL